MIATAHRPFNGLRFASASRIGRRRAPCVCLCCRLSHSKANQPACQQTHITIIGIASTSLVSTPRRRGVQFVGTTTLLCCSTMPCYGFAALALWPACAPALHSALPPPPQRIHKVASRSLEERDYDDVVAASSTQPPPSESNAVWAMWKYTI